MPWVRSSNEGRAHYSLLDFDSGPLRRSHRPGSRRVVLNTSHASYSFRPRVNGCQESEHMKVYLDDERPAFRQGPQAVIAASAAKTTPEARFNRCTHPC